MEKRKQEKDELARANAKVFTAKMTEGNRYISQAEYHIYAFAGEIKFTLEAEAHMEEGEQIEDDDEEVPPAVAAAVIAATASTTEAEDGEKTASVEMEEAGEIIESPEHDAEAKEGSETQGMKFRMSSYVYSNNNAEKEAKSATETTESEVESAESEIAGSTEIPKMISTKPAIQRRVSDRVDQALESQPGQPTPQPQPQPQPTPQPQPQPQPQQQQQQQQQNKRVYVSHLYCPFLCLTCLQY